MSRLLENLLCGAVGYGFGKRNREFTQEEVESLIRSYLKGVPLKRSSAIGWKPTTME